MSDPGFRDWSIQVRIEKQRYPRLHGPATWHPSRTAAVKERVFLSALMTWAQCIVTKEGKLNPQVFHHMESYPGVYEKILRGSAFPHSQLRFL